MTSTNPPVGSPTWYDVLGLTPDATAEQIKAAWRQATDRFEPGSASGQFRMFNEAADVLLDPARRAAYDAALGVVVTPRPTPSADSVPAGETPQSIEDRTHHEVGADSGEVPDPATEDGPRREGFVLRTLGRSSLLVIGVLAVLTVAALVLSVVLGVQAHRRAEVLVARTEAPAAADQAAKNLFSYDYRTLPDDRTRAKRYLAGSFAQKYLKNFDTLEKQPDGSAGLAVQSKAVVTAAVQNTAVVDAKSDVVRVLVFLDVTSRKAQGQPQVFQNRVAMTMVKQGDRWLVSNVNSY